jgi:hypothetical protein
MREAFLMHHYGSKGLHHAVHVMPALLLRFWRIKLSARLFVGKRRVQAHRFLGPWSLDTFNARHRLGDLEALVLQASDLSQIKFAATEATAQ